MRIQIKFAVICRQIFSDLLESSDDMRLQERLMMNMVLGDEVNVPFAVVYYQPSYLVCTNVQSMSKLI